VWVDADRLAGIAVAAVPALAVVLFGAVEPEHALPLAAAAHVLGASAVLRRTWRGARPLPLADVTLPVLLLAAIPALQLVEWPRDWVRSITPGLARFDVDHVGTISIYPWATTLALVRWTSYAAFLVAALEWLRAPAARRAALTVVAMLGVAEALYGVGNLLLGNRSLLWLERHAYPLAATGTVVNRNHFAAVLQVCLLALLARRWLAPPRPTRADERALTALTLAGAAAIGVAVLLSHSRGGVLCLLAGAAVAGVLARRVEDPRGRSMVAASLALTLLLGAWVGVDGLVQRFHELPADAERGRPALWQDTLGVVRDFPLAGAGAGTFEAVFPAYRKRSADEFEYAHAHHDWLELAAEAGVAGIGLVAIALAAAVRRLRAGLRSGRGGGRLALAALAGAVVAPLLHGAVDFPLHIPGIVYLVLLTGAAALRLAGAPR
jgi:O-antigen ligase